MKRIFTLIAATLMAVGAFAQQTDPVVYTFDNQESTYVVGDNCEKTTYGDNNDFSVNYTGASSAKMQIKLAANTDIFFEYSNSSTSNNTLKTSTDYVQFDKKNFIINIPVKTGDVVYVKYTAKGGTAAKLEVNGYNPPIEESTEGSVNTNSSKENPVIFKAVATKGGTAKIKETSGGVRVYAISINQAPDSPAGIKDIQSAPSAKKTVKKQLKNGRIEIETARGTFNVAGAQVN